MTPQAFAADLATIPAMDDLTVRICSGGGDVWAAQAIGAMLENRLGTVTAQIEGICASAATIVASHCKVVKAAEDATYMIHPIKVNPNGFVDMEGLKQLMDALTVMRTNVLNQYAKKTGHTVEEVAAWMDATSWWTAAEAKENGFIDEITESNQTAKIENRNGALFVNSIAVPGTFDDAPEFVRNRAVVAPATTEGFVNNTDPAGKPDKNDGGNDMEFKNADELRNGCPDLVKEIVDEAHAEAQKQERDRLAAIDEIADAKETIGKNLDFTVGGDVTFKVGTSTVKVCQSGTIEITGTTVKITGATVNISGGSGDCKINGVSLVNHKHEHDGSAKAGPYTVSGNTGVPVK